MTITVHDVSCRFEYVSKPIRRPGQGVDFQQSSHRWVAIIQAGQNPLVTVDYYTGIGHATGPKQITGWGPVRAEKIALVAAGLDTFGNAWQDGRCKPTPPEPADFWDSLRLDCEVGAMTFRDYCNDYGWADGNPADALATWQACVTIRDRLQASGFTDDLLERLSPQEG